MHTLKLEPIVPARGLPGTMQDLQRYRDMLVTVRDHVRDALGSGRTKEDIVAAKLTRELDATWGHGPIPPDRFVEMVYHSLVAAKPTTSAAQHHH